MDKIYKKERNAYGVDEKEKYSPLFPEVVRLSGLGGELLCNR